MPIPTEPIGSIPRPPELVAGMGQLAAGRISEDAAQSLFERAVRDTIQRFEATGSPVISDGEQSKPSFVSYPIHGLATLKPDGVTIPFADGHVRLGAELALSSGWHPRLLASRVPRRSRGRSRARHPRVPDKGCARRADRLHRGPAGGEARLHEPVAQELRRPQQPRVGAVHAGGAAADWRPHVPWRRPRLHAQRGCGLWAALAQSVRAQGRELLHPARKREGPPPRARYYQAAREARPENLRRRDRPDQSENRDARRSTRSRP